jgi:hypothetical protein
MLRVLVYAIPFVLAIYSIVDCLQTPEDQLRVLPKFGWLVVILVPLFGPVAYLRAGRPRGGTARQRLAWPSGPSSGAPGQPRQPRRFSAPDDDPDFLRQLGRDHPKPAESSSDDDPPDEDPGADGQPTPA